MSTKRAARKRAALVGCLNIMFLKYQASRAGRPAKNYSHMEPDSEEPCVKYFVR